MFRKKSSILRMQNASTLFVCVAGITLNMLANTLVTVLKLPLYLDTLGTVIVAATGGYLPGVIVGLVTNLIKSISDSSAIYYGALNVIIALFATYLAHHGYFKKKTGLCLAIILFTLIGGGVGSLIPWFIEGLAFDSESLSGVLYETGLFNRAIAHILSGIISDLPDKVITVLLANLFLRVFPKRLYKYCRFSTWKQNPMDENELGGGKTKIRIMSLRFKLLLVLVFSLTSIAVIGISVGLRVYYRTCVEEYKRMASGAASLVARMVDGDRIEEFILDGEDAEGYKETENYMSNVLTDTMGISNIYVFVVSEDGYTDVFDVHEGDEDLLDVGDKVGFDEGITPQIPKLLKGEEVEPILTKVSDRQLITAMKPVYDSVGRCACYSVADVDMANVLADERSFLVEVVALYLSFSILLCTFVMWLTDYHIIFPIRTITDSVDIFSFDVDSQNALDKDVRAFRNIGISTGDELEKMYRSLCRMTLNQTEQMRSIRMLSNSTAKMQDGLIVTMADMVENRDSDTGAHIQKTAAYVKIIVEGLKKKGYYAEKITPKFISDVVRSAPLHDVGKINIPDEILNKPGKLTPEEFEIMKTHTTAGGKILDKAISITEGDNYLKEARNMAMYHHERWDGKGYPERIHGEVIPLSARIMSVADVFDALTSPRVYKAAFPIEKALAIIEEGKGTQFDPKCVEVFMESLDEVKAVLKKYSEAI